MPIHQPCVSHTRTKRERERVVNTTYNSHSTLLHIKCIQNHSAFKGAFTLGAIVWPEPKFDWPPSSSSFGFRTTICLHHQSGSSLPLLLSNDYAKWMDTGSLPFFYFGSWFTWTIPRTYFLADSGTVCGCALEFRKQRSHSPNLLTSNIHHTC